MTRNIDSEEPNHTAMLEAVLAVAHDGEGSFPTWPARTVVTNLVPCQRYRGWQQGCVDGRSAYFPEVMVQNGRLLCAYNPTELALPAGSRVQIRIILGGWAWVRHEGVYGWLPTDKLDSVASAFPTKGGFASLL